MTAFVYTLMCAVLGAFALLALFRIVIPWAQRRPFKKYFDMTVVPCDDAERSIARPYMTARLQLYQQAFDTACKERQQFLLGAGAALPGQVDAQIEELRKLTASMEQAGFQLRVAQRIYDLTYPTQNHVGGVGVLEI